MQFKNIIFTVCIGFAALNTNATTEAQEKLQVLQVMKKYTGVVACKDDNNTEVMLKNIFTVIRDSVYGEATYIVLWSGDVGCQGGSGTQGSYLTEVKRLSENRPFTVNVGSTDSALYFFGDENHIDINYRFIVSLKKINSKKFDVIAWKHADDKWGGSDSGQNFPANKFKYTIEEGQYGRWKITNKILLEQKE